MSKMVMTNKGRHLPAFWSAKLPDPL